MSEIEALAGRQLDAYNASDLGAFVDCYHGDVRVYEGEALICEGRAAFRERYRRLFETMAFGASVDQRLCVGDHCVDRETWWRVDPESGVRLQGEILVCYQALEGRIGTVRFLK